MKSCKDIENDLPLYLDNSLSTADKKTVEEHLKSCPQCTKTLAQLSKAATLVNSLNDVNPPPWFKQKIMTRVREEAEKKSFIQKWFYPFRIKIPVQIFATVCIAVLAIYIYKTGEKQMGEVVTSSVPAPTIEVQKNQLPKQKLSTSTNEDVPKEKPLTQPDVIRKKSVPAISSDAVREVKQPDAEDIPKEKPFTQPTVIKKERVPAISSDAVREVKQPDVKAMKVDKYESAPVAESAALPEPALEMRKDKSVMGAAMKTSRAPQAQSSAIKSNILLKISNMKAAVEETEKLLGKYEAKNVNRQIKQGKYVIAAQLKSEKIKDFLTQLEKIGHIEESILPVVDAEENISIVVEFSE